MAQTFQQSFDAATDKYKNMSDKDLFSMIEKKAKDEPAKAESKEAAAADDAEAKAIEKIVAQRIFDRIYPGYAGAYPVGYGYYPYYYPYAPDIAGHVASIKAYHDAIVRAEAINAIAGMVAPSADLAVKILEGAVKPEAPPKEEKPKDKAFLQVEEQGVPVWNDPVQLRVNEVADVDLKQKDYILDGINGIDFVQTKAEGVPVYVNPTLLPNEAADVDLKQRDYILDGMNGIDFVQLDNLQRPIDDTTLMVKGVPITVNPESMMATDTQGRAHLGLQLEVGYNTETLTLAQKEKNFLQLGATNPVVNPPFNNWSVNQPSPPHASGDEGHQDLELRDMIVDGVNGYDLVQLNH